MAFLDGKKTVVLGQATLREIWDDMSKTILPSWLPSAPFHVGDGKHGKLTADQWRTFCTVHLVITLIRLWGYTPADGREYRLLVNFMHLVLATKAATMRSMSPERIKVYKDNMQSYLNGIKQLFPGVAFSRNHHLSCHLPGMLEDYGPTHSWRTFAIERFNYIMQKTPTNNKFGPHAYLLILYFSY